MIKQVIVIRKDLNMRKGKMMAQSAHASMKVFFDRGRILPAGDVHKFAMMQITDITPEMKEWIEGAFTKVVVGVETEEEIYALAEKAKQANLPYAVIIDNGMTEFAGKKTTTCIAIGPADSSKLDPITGDLKLM